MTKCLHRAVFFAIFGFIALSGLPRPTMAEPVRLMHEGRGLDGEMKLAGGKSLRDGVVILVHGTMAHNRMEIMRVLQDLLAERAISTVAVTLSLGVSDRKGTYDCAAPNRHSNAQAIGEIAAWVDWAAKGGATKIGLLGHSRGGTQVAHYAARGGDNLPTAVKKIILAAPATFDRARAASEYKSRYGGDFAAVLGRAEALIAAGKGAELMTDIGFMNCPKTSATAATFADYHAADGRNDAPSLLAKIRRPVLMVVAGGDEIIKDLPQKLTAAAKPASYAAVMVDGADHMFKDLYAEDLADAVAKFWAE